MTESILFFVESGGLKSSRVIKQLGDDESFRADYELRAVVDGESGKAVEAIVETGIKYGVTTTPENPISAVEGVTTDLDLDYIVSCGWIHKIPENVISLPNKAALNCHSSSLPDYKGLSVNRPQWAHAEKSAGATIHYLTEEFDEGNIVVQDEFEITPTDTPLHIVYKCSDLTVKLLPAALEKAGNDYRGEPHSDGRYYSYIPWRKVIIHAVVNHVLRAVGVDWRWEIDPR